MAIGASSLDKMHGYKVTQAGAELSNFLAWHLRWEIFSDYHFQPPAKLVSNSYALGYSRVYLQLMNDAPTIKTL